MGGVILGIIYGGLVSAIVLAAVSLSNPLPPRAEATPAVAAEAASEAPADADTPESEAAPEAAAARDETAPVEEPASAETPASEDPATGETAPEARETPAASDSEAPAETPTAAPAPLPAQSADPAPTAPDTAPDSAPGATEPATSVPLPSGAEFNRPPPEEEAALPSPDAAPRPAQPGAPSLAEQAPAPSFDTAPAPQPTVVAEAPQAGLAASVGAAPTAPSGLQLPTLAEAPAALSVPSASVQPDVSTAALPQQPQAPADTPEAVADPATVEAAPVPEAPVATADTETGTGIGTVPRTSLFASVGAEASDDVLPTIQPPTAALAADAATLPEGDAPEDAVEQTRAILRHAVPFEETDAPLMSVILIDEPDPMLDLDTLTRFSFPVTFAIDPQHPEAAERAAAYRAAGFEVMILASVIPEGAQAVDAEVAFEAAQVTLPEAVAVLDTSDHRLQGTRPLLDATVRALAGTGHGLVAYPLGLNAAEQTAAREGVPGATLFRLLDAEEERATTITRYLSRAAFAGAQEGRVIVVGHTRPNTVTALFSWALADRAGGVVLAPVSAALMRGAAATPPG